ncbi:DNA/RNA non-specific endonuclease [Methylobacterium nodulans]|uniref:Serine protease n=1 Tax=Methylobacterium nodulans (strain LMG 21967 / CNCM I-2342 / ORS 2060) TaxID=460265 RepID=B8ICT8_METNO|nr:DNA/RNA non-specific endonuclease [Methylobacterium nodulans]ACL57499.1 DNA/RNA non-specific endonuclease [Methylobacterium nodulans ORS 2060]
MKNRRTERIRSYLQDIATDDDIRQFQVNEDDLEAMRAAHATQESVGGLETLARPVSAQAVNDGLESLARGEPLAPDQQFGIEAIIIPDKRPAMPLAGGTYQATHKLWLHLNDPEIKARLTGAARSIGRIEVPGSPYPYGGTGFVVGKNLVMTNRHVAAIFAQGLGDRRITFISGITPGFSRAFAPDNAEQPPLTVRRVVMIHPYWDMALLEVGGLPEEAKPLTLEPRAIEGFVRDEIAVVGYPAFDPRNDRAAQKTVFDNRFGIKQLQPGLLKERFDTESFRKVVNAVTHDCSTLGGNSGSAIVHVKSGRVLALHFGGTYLARNYAVPASDLALDGRVVEAGLTFDPTANPDKPPSWSGYWSAADGEEAADAAPQDPPAGGGASSAAPTPSADAGVSGMGAARTIDLVIPIHVSIRVGQASAPVGAGEAPQAQMERLVEPARDRDYTKRRGFNEMFLGLRTPMPQAARPEVLARTRTGGDRLDYQNFSIRMHAKRRLALIVAWNAYAADPVKRPEEGRIYTRKVLGELGEHDQEKWFPDPRLDEALQLPDVFYTKDDGAFDKGHIARREDVAWGRSFEELKRANGDSFHVTNCSPQVAGFNQSARGTDNWGDLENVVLQQAECEKLCVFGGPILAADDPRFLGAFGGGRRQAVQIPARFWKVIVARTLDGLAAFGFVLEQDLSDVDLTEFVVPDAFTRYMEPLGRIAAAAGLVFAPEIIAADEFENRGLEVAAQSGVGRRGQA